MSRHVTKALVVDDDPGLLGIYQEVLRDEGYDVDTAATGTEAAVCLKTHRYDVLLSDMVLPDSSGLEVMRAARREGQDLPVVLITGHPTLQTAMAAVAKGASRYLQKPVSREELVATIETVIREHRTGARDREMRVRSATARRGLEAAFRAALGSFETACEPVVRLRDNAVVAYSAVTPDCSQGFPYSLAMVRAARRFGQLEELSHAARRSAAAVRRLAAQGLPLLVTTPLADVEAGRLLEEEDPLRPLARDIVLDLASAVPREGGRRLVEKLEALRRAGYRLGLPLPRPEEPDLPVGELGPVDFLRLDADAISGLERDPVRQALVTEGVTAASKAGAPLLAWGFATAERRGLLMELGCALLQVSRRRAGDDAPVARGGAGRSDRLFGWWSRLRDG